MIKNSRYDYKFTVFLLVSVAMACLIGCDKPSDKLDMAYRMINERPDSAYSVLQDIDYDDLTADSLKAKYILTRAWANTRVGRSLITDTLLDKAATYFISAGDTANWVISSQLQSGHEFMKGDAEAALRILEDLIPHIKNPKLHWDTYLHLLELSISSQKYERAYGYADWLLRHTNVPEETLKFATAKSVALYQQGRFKQALADLDSIIVTGVVEKVPPKVSTDFYCDYAEILDGAGYSSRAVSVIDSLNRNGVPTDNVEDVCRRVSLALFYANLGNTDKAKELLGSINHEGTQSVFEVYASIAMLKSALQFKDTGHFPSELMHEVTKTMQHSYQFAQFDRQTALETVIELNDDNYELKLQRQRLWLLISCISLLLLAGGVAVYLLLSRRKQRLIDAEERAETLERMLKDYEKDTDEKDSPSDSEKLKASLLRQLGIFKTFASTPNPQSRDALRKISAIGKGDTTIESLVDWQDFYSMIDNLFDGFHTKLVTNYPNMFNDKEQQIIVLLKSGFSTKEISVLTEQSSATIYTRKSVIRKKLATPEDGDFTAQLDAQFGTS